MNNRTLMWLIVIIVVVVGVVMFTKKDKATAGDYQAVFLTNGQVYFGQVDSEKSDPVVLKDVYYLQVAQTLQQVKEGEEPKTAQQIQLIKLGNELHGPMDEMRINAEQVLYIEDLKEDGKVVTTIRASQAAASASPSPSATK